MWKFKFSNFDAKAGDFRNWINDYIRYFSGYGFAPVVNHRFANQLSGSFCEKDFLNMGKEVLQALENYARTVKVCVQPKLTKKLTLTKALLRKDTKKKAPFLKSNSLKEEKTPK